MAQMKVLYTCLLLLSAPLIFAQDLGSGILHGTVTFGDWVLWGQTDLSSGTYSITLEYPHTPVKVKVKSERGKVKVFIPVSIFAGAESGVDRVCLVRGRDHWLVRSVELPELGISLLFLPRNQMSEVALSNCVPIAMNSRSGD